MIVQFETGKARIAFVKVPEDDQEFKIVGREGRKQLYHTVNDVIHITNQRLIVFPPGDWQILSYNAHEAAEGEWEKVVDGNNQTGHLGIYVNYKQREVCCIGAKESGLSLLEYLRLYRVNPYGKSEPYVCTICMYACENEHHRSNWGSLLDEAWHEAQERTGRWVVIYEPKK